jgi:segregation and condensation protein B
MTDTDSPDSDLAAALEAILFVADRPLSTADLAVLVEDTPASVADGLAALTKALEGRGLRLQKLDGSWQLSTSPAVADRVRRYAERAEGRLSPAAVEALAVVAYQQPVTRGDVERVRGVDSDSVMRSLLHRRLITEVGRRDSPGRPILFRTTFTFLERFGLESLEDLPRLGPDVAEAELVAEAGLVAEQHGG